MAMRGPGQIRELARIALPDVAVITNIAPVHLELVGTVEDVAAAKAEVVEELQGGTAIVPAGEPLLDRHLRRYRGRVVTFGTPDADVHILEQERRRGMTHVLVDAFGHRGTLDFSFTGGHYLHDALAALAAFTELGFRLDEAKVGAAQVTFSDLRGAVSDLPGGGLLLNDAYNANPLAMTAAVDHLVSLAEGRPTVAVLGDMCELGADLGLVQPEAEFREGGQRRQGIVQVVAAGEAEVESPAVTECVHQHVRHPATPLLLEDVDVRVRRPERHHTSAVTAQMTIEQRLAGGDDSGAALELLDDLGLCRGHVLYCPDQLKVHRSDVGDHGDVGERDARQLADLPGPAHGHLDDGDLGARLDAEQGE